MPIVKQKGILDSATNPKMDADVIMTTAVIGHAYSRLSSDKNCAFDVEADVPGESDQKLKEGFDLHVRVVAKINKALTVGGVYGKPSQGKEAIVGVTLDYNQQGGIARITGGSGDLPLDSPYRYDPLLPADLAGAKLYQLAFHSAVGYQGRGAYTGFVQGREGGQTNLFSTYRHVIPADPGRRWLPTDATGIAANKTGGQVAIGTGPGDKIWGMILTNADQEELAKQGIYFQDEDKARGKAVTLTRDDIVGYTHGMIQAIYDVEWRKLTDPTKKPGTPYEIAVGNPTTKLASCFTCASFMQANDYPASAIHLGRGESWCPLYPESGDSKNAQDRARTLCHDKWAAYCKTIVDFGIRCLEGHLTQDHTASFAKLKSWVSDKKSMDYANIILDAVTVHDSETKRLDRTIA